MSTPDIIQEVLGYSVKWSDITPSAARSVLYMAGGSHSGYPEPGGFNLALINAMFKADAWNLGRLVGAFPALGSAVYVYKNVPGGYERLEQIAKED